jgi:hypothetical protein
MAGKDDKLTFVGQELKMMYSGGLINEVNLSPTVLLPPCGSGRFAKSPRDGDAISLAQIPLTHRTRIDSRPQ